MTEEEIEAISARAAAATPAPWRIEYVDGADDRPQVWVTTTDDDAEFSIGPVHYVTHQTEHNAVFIEAAPTDVPALIAALREANALSEARNVEMERALKQSRENNEVALEWQRRYELETIICERVMAERDKAESALREAIAKIEKLLQLRPNVGVKKEQ